MTRTTTLLRAALTAGVVIAALAGCTAQPVVRSAGVTAAPASEQRFACPTRSEVAALTAIPFTSVRSGGGSCTYATSGSTAEVVLRHPAGLASTTLAALRYAATGQGATTTDAPRIAFDAFTSTTRDDCTVWFPASDGVASAVTATRDGRRGSAGCGVATAVATLAGASSSASAARTVAVIAPSTLLGTTTSAQRWPWRIGAEAGVRIDRMTGSGYLDTSGSPSFTTVAAAVPADSAAVVLVSGTAEAGEPTLTVLRDATRALSAAASRAPKARLVVVGPVADGGVPFEELANLRSSLQAAARIAGARYVDPSATTGSASAVLDGVADEVASALPR